LASAVLLLGGVSVFLGLLQAAEGPNSTWRFFSITNNSEAVGFFANRNHFSALLYVLLLFAACWAIVGTRRLSEAPPKYRTDAALILPLVVSLAAIVIFVAAQAYTRSRAGVGLGMVALAAVIVLSMTRGNGAKGRTTSRLLIGAIIAGLFMSVQFALYRVIERFEADPLSDDRVRFAANTLEAAQAHLPYGTGLGTFVPLYGLFEKPSDAIIDTFANRAHNDILEGWLETGLPGAILFACFLVWFLFAAYTAWMTRRDEGPLDTLLARAACVAIVLLLLHSFVDYPLRTAALQCLFAMSCAFLIPAEGGPPERELPRGRHAAEARTTGFSQASEKKAAARAFPWPARGTAARKRRPDAAPRVGAAVRAERWGGGDVEWPAEWHRAGQDAEASRAASAHEVSSTRKNRGHAGDNAVPPVAAGKITVDHDDMG
jgi:O-antigen ligase